MKTLMIILGIHAGLFALTFLIAGFGALASPSNEEMEALRREFEAEQGKGTWQYTLFCLGQMRSARGRTLSLAISHWPQRPEGRRLIYLGTGCLALALAIACFAEFF